MRLRFVLGLFLWPSVFFSMNPAPAAEDLTASGRLSADRSGSAHEVTIIRGSPRRDAAATAEVPPAKPQIVRAGVVGTGDNLWFIDSDGRIHACWLSGTGYVNSLRVACTR